MQVTQDCLVVSVQIELYEETLQQMRDDMLDNLHHANVRKAIIDLSSVDLIDAYSYEHICDTANMAKVMGTYTIIAGIQPGSASALVELGVRVGTVEIALNMEDAFQRLARVNNADEQIDLSIAEDASSDKDDASTGDTETLEDAATANEDSSSQALEPLPERHDI